jgi:predicted dehydrogenase
MEKLRVAVVGAGYFGARHAENYAAIERAELVAVCDIDGDRAAEVAGQVGTEPLTDHRALLDRVDAVSVATPTASHRPIAGEFLERGIPVLLEKPMSRTLEEADELIRLADRSGAALQIGHLERFNAAVLSAGEIVDRPRFIDCRRIAQFRQRGTDVSVVLDLMIHDIDLVLDIVKAPIDWIDAVGVPVLSDADDIANARIRFADGSVATITASRVSWKTERSIRIFQPNAYILVDLNDSKLVVTRKVDGDGRSLLSQLHQEERKFEGGGNLRRELESFLHSVETGEPPLVTGADGRRALAAALDITDQLLHWRETV